MGPFIVRRQTRTAEVERIAELLRSERWRDINHRVTQQMHIGHFVRVGEGRWSHLECDTCGWRTQGPVINRFDHLNYRDQLEQHRHQWRTHRAEMAIAAGLEVPD